MNPALKLSDSEIIAAKEDNCGCLKLPGQVGGHGWHWWVGTREYLETVQKMRWRKQHPLRPFTEFKYDPAGEASYLGQLFAGERCPAYVAAVERSHVSMGQEGGRR